MPISTLIVEDDLVTRQALAGALRNGGVDTVLTCGSGEEALVAATQTPIDVALVDIGLPGISGIETIRRLRETLPNLRALVLTVVESAERIVAAFEAGATGYLLKDSPIPEVVKAVEQVRIGLAPISPAVARHIVTRLRGLELSGDRIAPKERLTTREQEILAFLVNGHSYAAIASALAIGLGTVQSHVKSIYRKLQVSSKAEAVGVALTRGLLGNERKH